MDNRLAHEVRSTQSDFEEIIVRNRRIGVFRIGTDPPPERRSTISSMLPCSYQNTRMRNLSGGSSGSTTSGSSSGSSTQLDNQLNFLMDLTLSANNLDVNNSVPSNRGSSFSSHRKLDRSWSDTDSDKNGLQRSINSSRYKTELCRPFEESGSCKYGDKCQFAHGYHELRNLARHPKYKTELCRTFHTVGFCPYGPRCHFVHEDETKPANQSPKLSRDVSMHSTSGSSSPSLSPSGSDFNIFSYQTESSPRVSATKMDIRQLNTLTVNTDYSRNIYDLQDLDKSFSNIKLDRANDNKCFSVDNSEPLPIGSEERDIFSEITMFNSEEVQLDNAPKASSFISSQHPRKLDNHSFMENQPGYWQSSPYDNYYSIIAKSADSSHSSPNSSDGSSSGSNHGGSTESLSNSTLPTNWRSAIPIGQY